MANILEKADAQIAALLSDWSILTTLLALVIVAFVAYPIIYAEDPDTHPLLLSRQSSVGLVRKKHESAIYRSPETPVDTPLKSGLNVKEAGAPRWAAGKDGDVRDVWREVMKGGSKDGEGKELPKGAIMTVLGKEEVVEHDVQRLSLEIRIVGQHLKESGVKRVAVYLPNSMEYLMTVFACAFYGITPILLPYNLPHPKVYEILNSVEADGLICAAGNLPLDDVAQACSKLRLLNWVVEKTSRHMDWNGGPENLSVSVWHDVVEENASKTTNIELPADEKLADIITVQQSLRNMDSAPSITTFTHSNIISATAALISTLPLRQRLSAADLVLPASAFNNPYVLCQTLAALYQHASLAITSVAEPGVDLALATRGVKPTVIIASAETMASLHAKEIGHGPSILQRASKYRASQSLLAGRMPRGKGLLARLLAPSHTPNDPGKLRLILTSHRLGLDSPVLTASMLTDLRILTRARMCYALTSPQVAGAVTQTHVFDYRADGDGHFGAPVSCVEVKIVNGDDGKVSGGRPEGEVVVSGPAVCGGKGEEVRLPGFRGRMREDGCLELV